MDNKITYGLIGLGVVGAGVGGYFLWKWYQNQMKISPDQEIFDKYIKEGGGSTTGGEEAPQPPKLLQKVGNIEITELDFPFTTNGSQSFIPYKNTPLKGMTIKFGEKIYKQRNTDVEKAYPNDGGAEYHYTHYGYKNQITDPKSPRRAVFVDKTSWKYYEIDEKDYFNRFKDVANDPRYSKLPAAIHYIEQGWKQKRIANMIEVTA